MVVIAPQLNSKVETYTKFNCSEKPLNMAQSQKTKPPYFLQAIIEGFVDGVLILTEQGDWVHANEYARRICNELSQGTSQFNAVPQQIWNVCESLIDSYEVFPELKMIIESEVDTDKSGFFRIRARWLVLDESVRPYLLVTIEDRRQSNQNIAIADAQKYGLTRREAEVWLLRRANYSYKEIAAKLYITHNTVKKHLKNIYAKQQENLWTEEQLKNPVLRETRILVHGS